MTIVDQLFCARVRHRLCPIEITTDVHRLTLEQARQAADVFIRCLYLPPRIRRHQYELELKLARYHQRRSAASSRSHCKTRLATYHAMRIAPDGIKSVEGKSS